MLLNCTNLMLENTLQLSKMVNFKLSETNVKMK